MHPSVEKRFDRRQRVLKGALIVRSLGQSTIRCMIRNQHAGGAELRIGIDDHIPETFLLDIETDGVAYRTEMRWRRNERMGVRFIGKVVRPHLRHALADAEKRSQPGAPRTLPPYPAFQPPPRSDGASLRDSREPA